MSETKTQETSQVLEQTFESGTSSEPVNLFEIEFNHNILVGEEIQRIEDAISPYVGTRHDLPEVTGEITQLFEEFMESKGNKISQFIVVNQLAGPDGKKMLLKVAKKIQNPYFIECLITELEARKHKLKAKFKSYTPEETN